MFQSPRRWGGVGLALIATGTVRDYTRFNPLGGGAGSGSNMRCQEPTFTSGIVSIPSEVGGVGLHQLSCNQIVPTSLGFNPLGGGAGSGSLT